MAQLVQTAAPAAEYWPASHFMHADPDTYVPAEQLDVVGDEHDDAPALEVMSVAQLVQAVAPYKEYVPAVQLVQVVPVDG